MISPSAPSPAPIRISCGRVLLAGREILAPLDLTLSEQRIGVIGRNGSGKTTFLRLLAGLIPAESGSVSVNGADLARERKLALGQIGILFQNPDHQILFPTVEEELAFGLRQQGLSQSAALAHAHQALRAEGRAHWAKMPVSSLSGGQKQFLCLLSVLMMAPSTLLLDEPFSGLDLPTIFRLKRRLAALPQRLITITHDPASLEEAQRLIWIERGAVLADGPPATVLPVFTSEMERLGAFDADTDLAG